MFCAVGGGVDRCDWPKWQHHPKNQAGVTTEFLYDIRNNLGVRQDASGLGRYGYDGEGPRT